MPDVLPKEFWFSHEYALFLHDILAQTVVTGAQTGLFDTQIKMESAQEVEEFEQLSDSLEVWEWIERSRQRDVIYQIIYKQLMHGMLSDFCHFIYESLAVHCGVPSLVPADEQEARCRRRRTGEWEFAT